MNEQFGYTYDLHCKTGNYNRASIPCFVESSATYVCTAHKLACVNNDIKMLLMVWPRTQCSMPVIHTQSHRWGGCTTQAFDSSTCSRLKYYHVSRFMGLSCKAVLQDMQADQCKHALFTSCKCKSLTLLIDLCKASPRQCRYEGKITGIKGNIQKSTK